jgi:hypothetical protein
LRSKNSRKENARNEREGRAGDRPGTGGAEWKCSETVNSHGIIWVHCGEIRVLPETRQSKNY